MSKNAKSKKWKNRNVRPNDTLRLINKVITQLGSAKTTIKWPNLDYGQLVAIIDSDYVGFAYKFKNYNNIDYVQFCGPFASIFTNSCPHDPKSWTSGSCFELKTWNGYKFPSNPVVLAEKVELSSTQDVYHTVMEILDRTAV